MRFYLLFVAGAALACPPLTFRTESSANLQPSTSTHVRLVRQGDGSYTGYEIADAAPYRTIRVTPDFQNRVTPCSLTSGVTGNTPPETFTRLPSGDYLYVGAAVPVIGQFNLVPRAVVFDASMHPIAQSDLPASGTFLALADLNGDGNPDIIFGTQLSRSANITVLLGTGGAGFQTPVVYGLASLTQISAMTVGDLDGDGKPDVVVASRTFVAQGSQLLVLYGNGDGTLQAAVNLGGTAGQTAIAIGDVNRDGIPDLVFSVGTPSDVSAPPYVAVELGKGGRVFGAPSTYPTGSANSLAIGDIDGDGNPDIVTNGITIYFGDGTGGFPRRRDYWNDASGSVILTDFDGDGKTDIVLGEGNPQVLAGNAVVVLFNRGGGDFSGAPASMIPNLVQPNNSIYQIVPADFNRDGIPDLAVKELFRFSILTGKGGGEFTQGFVFTPSAGYPGALTAADFNGDGIPDLAVAISDCCNEGDGRLVVFLGNGDGSFQAPSFFPAPIGGEVIAAADFTGDGKLDVAVMINSPSGYGTGDQVLIYAGDGKGGFAAPVSYPVGPEAEAMAVGDFNRDGRPDLAVTGLGTYHGNNSALTVLLSAPGGRFSSVTIPTADSPYAIVSADFNGDGALDLVVGFTSGRAGILLGSGDGTFAALALFPDAGAGGIWPSAGFVAADLNGDSIPDLAGWGSVNPGIFLGNGDGTFQPEIRLGGFGPVAAADLNRDGTQDLIMPAGLTGVAAFLNLSQPPPPLTVVSAASLAAGPLAPDSLAAAFGSNLSGAAVSIRDAAGVTRAAQVLYASANQINFVVPTGTIAGAATVSAASASATVPIAAVAPSLFTWDASGLAAAGVVRVAADGTQTMGTAGTAPIDLGPPGTQVYLVLFGTGIRNAGGNVSVRMQGVDAIVTYSGPQGNIPGLDQVNVAIPRELAGAGQANIVLTAAGVAANTVHVSIQ